MSVRPEAQGPAGDWRSGLEALLRDDAPPRTGAGAGAGDSAPAARLALSFELRELTPRTSERWNGPTSRPAGRADGATGPKGNGVLRLGVRPAQASTGGWSRSGLGWSTIAHQLHRRNLSPAQHGWFARFQALHRAANPPTAGRDVDWIFLDDIESPVLWPLLDEARALGIAFVGPRRAADVVLAGGALLGIDLSRDAGALHVRPRAELDGEAFPLSELHPIAGHGVYVVSGSPSAPRYLLAPVSSAEDARRLLRNEGATLRALRIPAEQEAEFVREYLRPLARRFELTSDDGSVEVPAPEPVRARLDVVHARGRRLELNWSWERSTPSQQAPAFADRVPEGLLPDALAPGAGAEPSDSGLPGRVTLTGEDAADFVLTVQPRLQSLPDVIVHITGAVPPYRLLEGEPTLSVSVVPSQRTDWFDLGVEVRVGDVTIPFEPLFRALAAGRTRLLLVDGSYLSLRQPLFAPLAELIAEAAEMPEWEPEHPTLRPEQLALWHELEELADEATAAAEWRSLVDALGVELTDEDRRPADGLTAALRPYQADGAAWMLRHWRHGVGGVLADDMGLGKTLQCIAFLLAARERHGAERMLVVAPTSVVPVWLAEAERFAPGLDVEAVTTSRTASGEEAARRRRAQVIVTSYAVLRRSPELFDALLAEADRPAWDAVIVDEAQAVKNRATLAHRVLAEVRTRALFAVTGTPIENSLGELHAILSLTTPGLLGSAARFRERYVVPIERAQPGISEGRGAGSGPAEHAAERARLLRRLRRRIRPVLLRRTKDEVAPELPERQEQVVRVPLDPWHRRRYTVALQRERQKLLGLLEDLDRNRFTVFRSLTLLRLLALDGRLVDDEAGHDDGRPGAGGDSGSAKLDALVERLRQLVGEGHRALVFSQFTRYLALVERALDSAGIETAYLDGATRDRAGAVAGFRDGDGPAVFLISLKAGGVGLTLTEADYVFLLDPWWNPAVENQAIDRAHRIGQTRPVMVYRMIAEDTIEEKVLALQARKARLFDEAIDDHGEFAELLDADAIRSLLG